MNSNHTAVSANSHRDRLLAGLLAALQNLAGAGCRSVLLDGSFVSQKDLPEDYDGAWDTQGVDPYRLDPVLLDFSNGRAAMKSKYLIELDAAASIAPVNCDKRDRRGWVSLRSRQLTFDFA